MTLLFLSNQLMVLNFFFYLRYKNNYSSSSHFFDPEYVSLGFGSDG